MTESRSHRTAARRRSAPRPAELRERTHPGGGEVSAGAQHAAAPRPLLELQRALGNAAVQRLVQRYTVPGALDCGDLVNWLDTSSPYAPEWAETRSTYTFHGNLRVTYRTLANGNVEARVRGHPALRVTVSSPVDRPNWSPTPRPNRAAQVAAWSAMRASLDKHEAQHRKIAEAERARMQAAFRALDFTVVAATQQAALAAGVAQAQSEQAQWQQDAQTAQSAIDPFRGAVLACPP